MLLFKGLLILRKGLSFPHTHPMGGYCIRVAFLPTHAHLLALALSHALSFSLTRARSFLSHTHTRVIEIALGQHNPPCDNRRRRTHSDKSAPSNHPPP